MSNPVEISLVVPAYNEAAVLPEFLERAKAVLNGTGLSWEIIFADDGSHDATADIIRSQHDRDPRIGLISLSRNFGKEIAMTAGLDHSTGKAVIVIDADLQDPPELIPDMLALWGKGYDIVFARRTIREGETAFKRATAYLFYRVINLLVDRPIPADVGDFRLMSRRAVDAVLRTRERHRFMKGLFAWIGFRQTEILYERSPRAAGQTKWGYWRLWNFSIEGITSFSIGPLQFASYLGFLIAALAAMYGIIIIVRTILHGNPVPGYPSLLVIVLFLGGVQLLTLGIIGEYVGRIFNETKGRPLYLIADSLPASLPEDKSDTPGSGRAQTAPLPEDRRIRPSPRASDSIPSRDSEATLSSSDDQKPSTLRRA